MQIDPNAAGWQAGETDDDGEPLPIVKHPYSMAKYTLTNELYDLFDGPLSQRYGRYKDGVGLYTGDLPAAYGVRSWAPVVAIDWYDAWVVGVWLGSTIPQEKEWEYACRAGKRTRFSVGDGTTLMEKDARFGLAWEVLIHNELPTDVDKFEFGNDWGLYQFHGNVREWCADWFDKNQWSRCTRGGSYVCYSEECRSSFRGSCSPSNSQIGVGIRLSR